MSPLTLLHSIQVDSFLKKHFILAFVKVEKLSYLTILISDFSNIYHYFFFQKTYCVQIIIVV